MLFRSPCNGGSDPHLLLQVHAPQAQTRVSCTPSLQHGVRCASPATLSMCCSLRSASPAPSPCTAGSDPHFLHPILAAWVHCRLRPASPAPSPSLQHGCIAAHMCISCSKSVHRRLRPASSAPSPCTAASELRLLHPILATGGQMCISCSKSMHRRLRSASPAPHPCNVGSAVHLLLRVHAPQPQICVSCTLSLPQCACSRKGSALGAPCIELFSIHDAGQ